MAFKESISIIIIIVVVPATAAVVVILVAFITIMVNIVIIIVFIIIISSSSSNTSIIIDVSILKGCLLYHCPDVAIKSAGMGFEVNHPFPKVIRRLDDSLK